MKYRKKPVVIEAFQLGIDFIPDWFMDKVSENKIILHGDAFEKTNADIETLEGWMHASYGDYIIRGVKGEIYACKPDVFDMTYDAVEEEYVTANFCEFCEKKDILTPNQYQLLASRTMRNDLSVKEQQKHALFGMAAELGELHGIYQKVYQGHKFDTEHAKKELGDLLWFIAEYCTAWRWNLEDIMQMNIDKLRARYPDGFDADHSLHRAEGDI